MKLFRILSLAGSLVLLNACGAGDEPYRELPKDVDQVTTQAIDQATDRQYMYIRSVGKAPRYAANIRGFFQGTPKLVTLHRTENGIQVRQVDRDTIGLDHDSRFSDNGYNQAPVLTIPGQYVDYRCTEDRWGDCVNVEQLNTDADQKWYDKGYFVPDFAATQIAELSVNDLFALDKTCVSESEAPRLVQDGNWRGHEMDLDKGVINLEIEHTYRVSPSCLDAYYQGNFDNFSFTTTEFISIVAVDQLASPDYQPVPYAQNEDGTFGFFTTEHRYRDANHAAGSDGYVRTYLNRFNPALPQITYYLSNNFYLPKNQAYLDSAKETVDAINIQNRIFHTGLPPIVLERAGDKRHGDLRYSFISLFDEPLDNGLAGYGPSAANPLTGEIVSARTNQYSSNLKQGAVRYYRQLMLDYNRGKLEPASVAAALGDAVSQSVYAAVVDGQSNGKASQPSARQGMPQAGDYVDGVQAPAQLSQVATQVPSLPVAQGNAQDFDRFAEFDQATQDFWAEHSLMHVDVVYATGPGVRQLPRGVKGHLIDWDNPQYWLDGQVGGQLKAIDQMPVAVQDDLTTKLAAQAFSGTLTHELGHNLGLRHNFAGSRDHDNLFTDQELEHQHGAFAAAGYPTLSAKSDFSSQMDYNVNRFATTFEPYDLAALRFGYGRQVETQAGEFVSLQAADTQRREELAKGELDGEHRYGVLYNVEQQHDLRFYSYCTDGHVSLNSNCNRGDAGADNDAIVQFYIDKYWDSYDTDNLRHNRQAFYEDHILGYAVKRNELFMRDIRQFVEDPASIERQNTLPMGSLSQWCLDDDSAWYCAYTGAVDKAGDFFLTLVGESDATLHTVFRFDDGSPALTRDYKLADLLAAYRSNAEKLDGETTPLAPGELVTRLQDRPDLLKDLVLKFGIVPDYWDQLHADITFSGRMLNGMKSAVTDPNHPYVNERDVLGVWPDKLLAVRALVTRTTPRSTTGRTHLALVDDPKVGEAFKAMLCQMTVVDTAGLNFGGESIVGSQCDSQSPYLSPYLDAAQESIEPLVNYDRSVSRYFGFDTVNGQPKGESNLLQMMLRQVVLASVDSDYQGEQKARRWREYVGVHYASPGLAEASRLSLNGRVLVATEENVLAAKLMAQIKRVEQFMDTNADLMGARLSSGELVGELLTAQLAHDKQVLGDLPVL
ncbi:zinc-dependent metalloprotease [Ferrimonas marina]|uniref:Pregnancy-associated plasma protein-A n=1 Tax=Ferrimonas marina TaxID=299255 RepID=A0A1M5S7U4_9GAMM|nr:zinc-dependent metalloprotease [Ferrimonas marina]SHH34539.1 Pregnancy-associated plasma protein-A [Ferrimonas marina]